MSRYRVLSDGTCISTFASHEDANKFRDKLFQNPHHRYRRIVVAEVGFKTKEQEKAHRLALETAGVLV